MTDIPREPLDHEPDEPGWSLAPDGLWYPPETAAPTEPLPAVVAEPARTEVMPSVSRTTVRSVERAPALPLWLKVAAVVVAILAVAGIAFAIGQGADDDPNQPAVDTSSTSTVSASTVPATPVPSTRPPVTPAPTTVPAPTAPPSTTPPATTTPATQPPPTEPPPTTSAATTPST